MCKGKKCSNFYFNKTFYNGITFSKNVISDVFKIKRFYNFILFVRNFK